MAPLIIILLLLIGWDFAWYFVGVKPLSPWRLKKLLKEKNAQLTLIDVRTPGEFNWFHIDGAANMPGLLFNADGVRGKSVDEPVIVICMTGHRSPPVAYQIKKRGYKQVYNLTWGMLGWKLWGMTIGERGMDN
jgi:rhodanese-related sulfurtransferase